MHGFQLWRRHDDDDDGGRRRGMRAYLKADSQSPRKMRELLNTFLHTLHRHKTYIYVHGLIHAHISVYTVVFSFFLWSSPSPHHTDQQPPQNTHTHTRTLSSPLSRLFLLNVSTHVPKHFSTIKYMVCMLTFVCTSSIVFINLMRSSSGKLSMFIVPVSVSRTSSRCLD